MSLCRCAWYDWVRGLAVGSPNYPEILLTVKDVARIVVHALDAQANHEQAAFIALPLAFRHDNESGARAVDDLTPNEAFALRMIGQRLASIGAASNRRGGPTDESHSDDRT